MIHETLKAEIRVTDGSMSFEATRVLTLDDVRAMIARAEALGVPSDAEVTNFSLQLYGDRVRCDFRWIAPRPAAKEAGA